MVLFKIICILFSSNYFKDDCIGKISRTSVAPYEGSEQAFMVDFVPNIRSELVRNSDEFRILFMLGAPPP